MLHRDASADAPIRLFWQPNVIEDHPHPSRAQSALHRAMAEIEQSQDANELFWSDNTGRALATRAAIEHALRTMDNNAAWLRNGMAKQARDKAW